MVQDTGRIEGMKGMNGEPTMNECTRKTTCYDCDNENCLFHGKKEADCPKYCCDRPDGHQYDCDHCDFVDRYIEDMRREYGR